MGDDLDAYAAEQLEDPVFARQYVQATAQRSFRDMVAWDACRWALRFVASRRFREWLEDIIWQGLQAAARECDDRPSRRP